METYHLMLVEINIDSIDVISMLSYGNFWYNSIIDECKSSLRRVGSLAVVHCFREQNSVADALAKKGVDSAVEFGIHSF